jgi:hypothetical protein
MATHDDNGRKEGKNVGPKDTDETEVTIGPYCNDLFTEILLNKTNYIKNCFYYMLKKGYFSDLASMDHIGIDQWVQDLSQIVKMSIWKLICEGIYVEKLKQKKYVRTIVWRKCDAENKRLRKIILINAI